MAMHPTAAAEREVGQPMQFFSHDGFGLAFLDRQPASGEGDPVLMIHGFASSHYVNWV